MPANSNYNPISFIWIFFLTFLLSSCTNVQNESIVSDWIPDDSNVPENISWHSCRFHITWPEGSAPDMDVDLLLAHSIIGPVLNTYETKLTYWRFHRRAVRDDAGHQFSFLFYTNTNSASHIKRIMTSTIRVQQLEKENIIEQISCHDVPHWSGSDITDSSDKAWSLSVQKNWPTFIMGVSKLWLGLIEDVLPKFQENQLSIKQLLDKYRQANKVVTTIWQSEGQHAFLHHLNAVFGYESLLIRY